ncbi:MAG: hypothetical protein KAT15_08065 [Bacteroidales bacterium]|nr:hypothetical protein [Bacteroidales bacterium]
MKKQLILVAAVLFGLLVSGTGQTSIDLNYQGMLADIQGNRITKEQFDLSIKVLSEPGTVLWETKSVMETDEEGWFGFPIRDVSRFLLDEGQIKETIVIRMEFLPNATTKWMRKGDDFMVSYTLKPSLIDDNIQLTMTRMEGSELVIHSEDHLYAFKDLYPFAYLTGGFLLTDKPPVNRSSKDDLRQWLSPDEEMKEGAASRGVKGGFASGGYRKKN